jgi:alpha-L-rhamnosidase
MKRIILALFLFSFLQADSQIRITNLRCEMLVNPLGIDIKEPRFSWQIESNTRGVKQTSYQLLVASSKEKLSRNEGDVWNSGKQISDQSIHIRYTGQPLQSGRKYFWKVKVFTNKAAASGGEYAFFPWDY